jgi:hypothetical protein
VRPDPCLRPTDACLPTRTPPIRNTPDLVGLNDLGKCARGQYSILVLSVYPVFTHLQQPQRALFSTAYGQEETGITTTPTYWSPYAYVYILPGIPPFRVSMRSTFRPWNILFQSCSCGTQLRTNWVEYLTNGQRTQTVIALLEPTQGRI